MNILVYLIPIALTLGLFGLIAFFGRCEMASLMISTAHRIVCCATTNLPATHTRNRFYKI